MFHSIHRVLLCAIIHTFTELNCRGSTIEKPKYDERASSDGAGSLKKAIFSFPTRFKSPEACHDDMEAARDLREGIRKTKKKKKKKKKALRCSRKIRRIAKNATDCINDTATMIKHIA